MSSISVEVLEEIGADVEQAVREIAAKYGMNIAFSGFTEADPEKGTADELRLEVVPADPADLAQEAEDSVYWKHFIGKEGEDGGTR